MKKTIGILGGMGPEATVYFYEQIVRLTKAERDQDHIKTIIYSNPEIPPRTDAISGNGPSPAPLLLEGFRRLKDAGADFVVMPCVTAHYFYPDFKDKVDIPLVSLLEETVRWVIENVQDIRRTGLVASTGTVQSKLFHDVFGREGIAVVSPEEEGQKMIMEAIFGPMGIKAGSLHGFAKETVVNIAKMLVARGADAIIAGCTEIPLVLKDTDIPVPLIDPLRIAAQSCINKAGYEQR